MHTLEGLHHHGVHPLHGGHGHGLPEGVNFLQIGAEGHAVQTRQLGGEQTALQTGVDGLHLGGVAVLVGEHLDHQVPQGGLGHILPAGVFAVGADGAAQPLHQGAKALDEHLLLGGHAAADAEGGVNGVVPGGEDAQVQGGLHQAGHIGAHGLDAVGQAGEHAHHAAAGAFVQGQQVGFRRADGDGDGRVVDPVFLFEGGVHFGADGLGGGSVGGHQ